MKKCLPKVFRLKTSKSKCFIKYQRRERKRNQEAIAVTSGCLLGVKVVYLDEG